MTKPFFQKGGLVFSMSDHYNQGNMAVSTSYYAKITRELRYPINATVTWTMRLLSYFSHAVTSLFFV